MQIALRPLTLADAADVARLYRVAYDDRLPWLAGRHTPEQDIRFFRERVFATLALVGAFAPNGLAGFVAYRAGWIDQLYVLPAQQRRGIGTAPLAHVQAQSDTLELWAFERNAGARAFYRARGFIAVRETDGTDNEEREPHVLYRWTRT